MNTMASVIEYSVVLQDKTVLRNRLEQGGVSENTAFLWQREVGEVCGKYRRAWDSPRTTFSARKEREEILSRELEFCEKFQNMPEEEKLETLWQIGQIPNAKAGRFIREILDSALLPVVKNLCAVILLLRLAALGETQHIWAIAAWFEDHHGGNNSF